VCRPRTPRHAGPLPCRLPSRAPRARPVPPRTSPCIAEKVRAAIKGPPCVLTRARCSSASLSAGEPPLTLPGRASPPLTSDAAPPP
jgi:hypothetical protein